MAQEALRSPRPALPYLELPVQWRLERQILLAT